MENKQLGLSKSKTEKLGFFDQLALLFCGKPNENEKMEESQRENQIESPQPLKMQKNASVRMSTKIQQSRISKQRMTYKVNIKICKYERYPETRSKKKEFFTENSEFVLLKEIEEEYYENDPDFQLSYLKAEYSPLWYDQIELPMSHMKCYFSEKQRHHNIYLAGRHYITMGQSKFNQKYSDLKWLHGFDIANDRFYVQTKAIAHKLCNSIQLNLQLLRHRQQAQYQTASFYVASNIDYPVEESKQANFYNGVYLVMSVPQINDIDKSSSYLGDQSALFNKENSSFISEMPNFNSAPYCIIIGDDQKKIQVDFYWKEGDVLIFTFDPNQLIFQVVNTATKQEFSQKLFYNFDGNLQELQMNAGVFLNDLEDSAEIIGDPNDPQFLYDTPSQVPTNYFWDFWSSYTLSKDSSHPQISFQPIFPYSFEISMNSNPNEYVFAYFEPEIPNPFIQPIQQRVAFYLDDIEFGNFYFGLTLAAYGRQNKSMIFQTPTKWYGQNYLVGYDGQGLSQKGQLIQPLQKNEIVILEIDSILDTFTISKSEDEKSEITSTYKFSGLFSDMDENEMQINSNGWCFCVGGSGKLKVTFLNNYYQYPIINF